MSYEEAKLSTTERMRADLEAALGRGDEGRGQLERWLRDLDLPPGSGDEEPYVWVLRGLSALDDYAPAERILAAWTAELLRQHPNPGVPAKDRDQYLYNLLRLAARLSSPDELWASLLKLYEHRSLDGSYLGVEHRDGLFEALVQNQADTRLREVWLQMARGEPDEYLGGTPDDGLWALTLGPDPKQGVGCPDLAGLEEALSHQVKKHLKKSERSRLRLSEQCRRILRHYPDREKLLLPWLLQVGDRKSWPLWAVTTLPSLFCAEPTKNNVILFWKHYWKLLTAGFDLRAKILGRLCRGEIMRVELSPSALSGAYRVLKTLETRRKETPFTSERALLGDLCHALNELEARATKKLAVKLRRGRLALLRRIVIVGSDQDQTEVVERVLRNELPPGSKVTNLKPEEWLIQQAPSGFKYSKDIIIIEEDSMGVGLSTRIHEKIPKGTPVIRLTQKQSRKSKSPFRTAVSTPQEVAERANRLYFR